MGPVAVLVRPERISLRVSGQSHDPTGAITGQVVHREYYGHDCVVLVDVGSKHLVRVRYPGRSPADLGDNVVLSAHGDVVAWQVRAGSADNGSSSYAAREGWSDDISTPHNEALQEERS